MAASCIQIFVSSGKRVVLTCDEHGFEGKGLLLISQQGGLMYLRGLHFHSGSIWKTQSLSIRAFSWARCNDTTGVVQQIDNN